MTYFMGGGGLPTKKGNTVGIPDPAHRLKSFVGVSSRNASMYRQLQPGTPSPISTGERQYLPDPSANIQKVLRVTQDKAIRLVQICPQSSTPDTRF